MQSADRRLGSIGEAVALVKQEYTKRYNRTLVETGNVVRGMAKYANAPAGLVAVELVDSHFLNPLMMEEPAYFWVLFRRGNYDWWASSSGLSSTHPDRNAQGFTFDLKIHRSMQERSSFFCCLLAVYDTHKILRFRREEIDEYVRRYSPIRENHRFHNQMEVGIPTRLSDPL